MRRDVLIDRERSYALTCDADGHLYLEVVVTGVYLENRVLPLSSDEHNAYSHEGKAFLDRLASSVAKDGARYADRMV